MCTMLRRTLLTVLLLAACKKDEAVPAAPAPSPAAAAPASPQSLIDATTRWYEGLGSSEPEKQRLAMESVLPSDEDVRAVFGVHAPAVLPYVVKIRGQILEKLPDIVEDIAGKVPFLSTEVVDLRSDPDIKPGQDPFANIAPNALVYRVIARSKTESLKTTAFVYVNGRWVWFKNFFSLLPLTFPSDAGPAAASDDLSPASP